MSANLPALVSGDPMIGVHYEAPAARYHADEFGSTPTLSSSIAKILLAKTPAHAWTVHPRLNVRGPNDEPDDEPKFDLGSAAHEMILGRGGGIEVAPYDSWRSKDAKTFRAECRAAGKTPMLRSHHDRAQEVAQAAWKHPLATYAGGDSEVVLVWWDIGGPLCRAMVDHLVVHDGMAIITDCKITDVALTDESLSRQVDNLRYDLSAGFYIRGLIALRPELAGRIRYRWHFIESTAPFGSRIVEATRDMLSISDRKAALAIATWKRCLAADKWPSWSTEITPLPLPWRYIEKAMEIEIEHPDADHAVFSDSMPAYEPKKLTEPV